MNDVIGLRRALLAHYDRAARVLPWRGETDPYRILVSEVMLQQTRVDTVRRYYEPWLERFPTLTSLAAADEDDVLKAWEGLGYYRRARNLHKTALTVRERHEGELPDDYERLRALPGVGEYTAGAVASIAFGRAEPAVDGNVRRVLARIFDEAKPTAGWLRRTAASLVDPDRPGDWNQAVMELGATVCTPRSPGCDECPVVRLCAARAAGTQLERPARREKRSVPTRRFAAAVIHAGGRSMLERRPADGLLGGLWAFPEASVDEDASEAVMAEAVLEVAASRGLSVLTEPARLPVQEHRFTHLHAVYEPWTVEVAQAVEAAGRRWVSPTGSDGVALPVAQRKILESWATTRVEIPGR